MNVVTTQHGLSTKGDFIEEENLKENKSLPSHKQLIIPC